MKRPDLESPIPRLTRAELVFWLLPVLAYFVFPNHLILGSQILIACIFVLSLDLIMGYAGMITLGHAAGFGVGAYTAGLLSVHGWGEPLSGLLAATLVAAVAGWLIALLIVRLGDLARLMVTLGMCLMLFEVGNKASSITGGLDGLSGMQMWRVLGLFEFDIDGKVAYLYSLVLLVLVFFFLRQLVASPFGLSLKGIHQKVARMPSLGVSVDRRLVAAFTVGTAIAGLAGGLLAQVTQFVGLDSLGFQRSADVLIMLMLGGAGRLYGGMVGAVVFIAAHHVLSSINPVYWEFWIGLMLVVIVCTARGGLVSLKERLVALASLHRSKRHV
ncbi:MAG TPA: branched-chain amino acid ABC transporter permease [Ramlibacter sp.]|nr:branched-chain amino acid ABC transporter permease [Ramlibacter sp.]